MDKKILRFINTVEGFKTAVKALHWDAKNLSQHKLCDDIASAISDFEDLVSEVEQSIHGNLPANELKPIPYKIDNLKGFVEDVISTAKSFLKELEGMGEEYVGIKSECETFIGTMQRNLYLVNFTLKEELKMRLKSKIMNESMPKNPMNVDDDGFDRFIGRRPKTMKSRINQIYKIVKKYGIDSRKYHDEGWQAIEDYHRAISSLGCEVEIKPCGDLSHRDSIESDGGYCDYDEYDNMPRSKQYAIKITFEDGMAVEGYIKCMAAGTVEDPFSSYDTCMILWPKSNRVLEGVGKEIRLSGADLKQIIKEATVRIINEYGNTPEKAYGVGKLMARQRFRDNDPHKAARTNFFHNCTNGNIDDERVWKKINRAKEQGYSDGKKQFNPSEGLEEGDNGIHIKKSKEGTFTAAATKHGKSVQGFASQVLNNKDDYSPAMVKKANFARNAKKWNKK